MDEHDAFLLGEPKNYWDNRSIMHIGPTWSSRIYPYAIIHPWRSPLTSTERKRHFPSVNDSILCNGASLPCFFHWWCCHGGASIGIGSQCELWEYNRLILAKQWRDDCIFAIVAWCVWNSLLVSPAHFWSYCSMVQTAECFLLNSNSLPPPHFPFYCLNKKGPVVNSIEEHNHLWVWEAFLSWSHGIHRR